MTEETKKETVGLAVCCKKFFGFKEGQKIGEFAAEIRQLSLVEKQAFAAMLSKEMDVEVVW